MPNPAVTLKLKQFRRHFGIAAPRVAVRTHFAWHWYVLAVVALVSLVAALVWWLAQRNEVGQIKEENASLHQKLSEMESELTTLRSKAGTEQSAVRMEKTTQQQLMARMRALEQENVSLKEDIALFERLVPTDGAAAAVRIERLSVVSVAEPGRYRYRLLVGYQPSKQEREFHGLLQLTVTALQGGKELLLQLPASGDAARDYVVETRHFLRKEGSFVLPVGAKLKTVEARLLQGGTVKAKQSANY